MHSLYRQGVEVSGVMREAGVGYDSNNVRLRYCTAEDVLKWVYDQKR